MFQILDIMDWYTVNLLDNMMADPPAWFQSFILCETVLQMPFFFVAAYAFWKGIETEQQYATLHNSHPWRAIKLAVEGMRLF